MWILGEKIIRKEITTNKNYNFRDILESKEDEIVLCVGQVQSGKTRKILEIIKIAIDLKYNYIIIFGGTTNPLLNQTQERLEEELIDFIISEKLQIGSIKNYERAFNKNIPLLFNIIKNAQTIDNLRKNIFEDLNLKDKNVAHMT